MVYILLVQDWGIGMGWGIALVLAVLVVAVGIYAKLRKR